jgi:hypothetical protein
MLKGQRCVKRAATWRKGSDMAERWRRGGRRWKGGDMAEGRRAGKVAMRRTETEEVKIR